MPGVKDFHEEILDLIKKNSGKGTQHTDNDIYLGNSNFRYAINMPTLRLLLKQWAKEHMMFSSSDLAKLITSLVKAPSSTEKHCGGLLLDYFPKLRKDLDPDLYDDWLNYVEGWAEIDVLCQGHFTAAEMLSRWKEWGKIIIHFSKSKQISKRRAAMVLLVMPARASSDERIPEISIQVIEQLKHETDPLITKAISWLLRSLVKQHKSVVEKYIREQKDSLPKVAVRETLVKLKTGTKSGRN